MKEGVTKNKLPGITMGRRIKTERIDMIRIEVGAETVIEHSEYEQEEIFGKKVGLFSRIFGCRHKRMSKPVTNQYITYTYCPNCGVRREFDLETYSSRSVYYYPPTLKEIHFV